MTSLTRWKLACALLAGIAGYTVVSSQRGTPANKPAATVTARGGALPQHLRRPLRINAQAALAAGVSREELVERALAARSLGELVQLTDKLGAVGDDETIDQLAPLVEDPRRGVPEAILGVYGQIATEHAVDALLGHLGDVRPGVRRAAIAALGETQSRRAEQPLVELAQKGGDSGQTTAIAALGRLGSERAIAVLSVIAKGGDYTAASAAVSALGVAATPPALVALRKLVDAPDPRIAAVALGALPELDEAMLERATQIVKTGDPQLVTAALSALTKAGEAALPVLREAPAISNSASTAFAFPELARLFIAS